MSPEVRTTREKPIWPTLIRVVGQSAFLPASAELAESAKIGQSAFPLRSRSRTSAEIERERARSRSRREGSAA
jgi:hypothetical protein